MPATSVRPTTYAKVLLHLGRVGQARPIVVKLTARGGRDPDLRDLCHENGLPYG